MRKFYTLGFAVENRIGKAVELETYDLAGCSPETIREAAKLGKPIPGFDDRVLDEGRRLGKLPPGIVLTVARRAGDPVDFDVVVNCLTWIILSNRLAGALRIAAPNDIELLPVEIRGLGGEILRSDFCVVNVLHMLDVVSEEKSIRSHVKWASGRYPIIKLAVIARKVPPNVHVFRVKERPSDFLLDDVSKRALSKEPHDGLAFIPVGQE
jgi:hypothetical protein